MTRGTFGFVSSTAIFAFAAGAALWLAPQPAISTPGSMDETRQAARASQYIEVAEAVASGLPGGASSLNETYEDWSVTCASQAGKKRCVLSQVQTQQNGQRVLTIELDAPVDEAVSGMLVMPFGLALGPGVTFQVDEEEAMELLRFRTCLPGGCLVPVSFKGGVLETMRASTALKIKAVADSGMEAPFSISLKGFATALDRVGELSR